MTLPDPAQVKLAQAELALALTALLLSGLMGLGLGLQLGWRRDQTRWPHHALYFAVTLSLAGTALLYGRAGQPAWALAPALLLLLSMPLTHPGRSDHWRRALLVAGSFLIGVLVLRAAR